MIKILCILGTRPEVIKLAPVLALMNADKNNFNVKIALTGQHRGLVTAALKTFALEVDFDLKAMKSKQSLFYLTQRLISSLERIIKYENPDCIMVQGDTTSAFIASLSAFYSNTPLVHIEAGLRTHLKYSPFPEELNRRLIAVLADLHFAPTKKARNNLIKEGISKKNIFVVGNTGVDALFYILKKNRISREVLRINGLDFKKRIILVTLHRREKAGPKIRLILKAIKELARIEKETEVVIPVHPRPDIKREVFRELKRISNIHLINPVNYEKFILLMQKSYLILTDSGGVQEEAVYLKKPVLVIRDETERPEGLDYSVAKLVSTEPSKIINEVRSLMRNKDYYKRMQKEIKPYGDGRASGRIIKILRFFKDKEPADKEFNQSEK